MASESAGRLGLSSPRVRIALLLASAVVGRLAYSPFNWQLLIWVSLVPLFACAVIRTPREALADGWLYGVTFFTVLLRWLDYTVQTYSLIPWPLSWLPLLGLAAYCGLFTGLVAAALSWLRLRLGTAGALLSAPFVWVAGEWLRGHLFSGFPWGLLGYSQAYVLPMIQIAEWTGVYGISFLVAGTNAALTGVVALRWRQAWVAVGSAAALVLGTLVVGWQSLDPAREQGLRVVVVQPSIDQAQKWDPVFLDQAMEVYQELTLEGGRTPAALVVWPETAAPVLLRRDPAILERIQRLAGQVKAPLILGSVDTRPEGVGRYLNSAFFVTEQGISGKYDKMHLVPFGEYLPLSRLLGFIRGWAEFISDFEAGSRPVVFRQGREPFGVVICYEGLFPELFRKFVLEGAKFMVNITNDAWFGRTSGPLQHLAVLPLRAVENRVAIARAANTGVSAIIEPSGRISRSLGLFERGVVAARLPLNRATTFYTRYGDVFAVSCLVLSLLAGIVGLWRPIPVAE